MPYPQKNSEAGLAISDYLTLHTLALAIADHAARSEIELYSLQILSPDGRRMFDTAKPREDSVHQDCLSIAAKAMQYIELRGSALPYRMQRSGEQVWFEELQQGAALAG